MTETGPGEGEDLAEAFAETLAETLVVPENLHGWRLDAAAAQLFPDYSRARLQLWIEDGSLLLNGKAASRSRQPVAAGDELSLTATPQDANAEVGPENIAIDVRYADDTIAVIHKPVGLTVHPGAGQYRGTLQNALLFHFPQTQSVPRAGIVHRLDKDTSGLLVVALTVQAHAHLVGALARREVRREYDALVNGAITAGSTVDAPLGRHPQDRLRMAVVHGGRHAVTHYRVQERFAHHTLLRVRLETGRTHQIRVHMAYIKHPIVGDSVYGGRIGRGSLAPDLRAALLAFPRQALHARELEFAHPVSGERLSFTAEPPADIQSLLQRLRASSQEN